MKPSTSLCLVLAVALPAGTVHPETGTTTIFNGTYTNAGGTFVVGNTGPANALLVTNAAWLLDNTGVVGNAAPASNNTAVITGTGSLWENTGGFYLGSAGAGNQLRVESGGQLKTPISYVGGSVSSSNNSALITGPQSVWNSGGGLRLGQSGSGNLVTVANGGRINSGGESAVGYNAPSGSNTLLVTGAGSAWAHYGDFSVGSYGSSGNQATIAAGAFLYTYGGYIGNGSNNLMTVTGPGSYWYNEYALALGNESVGNRLLIAGGATVYSTSAFLAGDDNSALVTDANSRWETGGEYSQIIIGASGRRNSLTITNGGRVNSWNGYLSGVSNSARVAGGSSIWSITDTLIVGEEFALGDKVTISAGGRVTSRAVTLAGDYGNLSITGTGSALLVTDSLTVGDEAGLGDQLVVSGGAQVSNTTGYVGGFIDPFSPYGRNTGNGATVSGAGSLWHNRGELRVGITGANSQLNVNSGARVNSTGGYMGYSGYSYNNTVWLTDTNSVWDNQRDLYVGYSGGQNRFVITNGAAVTNINGFVGFNYSSDNNAIVTGPGSVWHNQGGLVVGNAGKRQRLLVTNGARLNTLSASVGQPSGRENFAVVSGAGSLWSNATTLLIGANNSLNEVRVETEATLLSGSITVGNSGTSFNNFLTVAGGNVVVTNASGTAAITVSRAALNVTNGFVLADRLLANGGVDSVVNLIGGTVRTKNAAIANGQPLLVGDGTGAARLELPGGNHSFADGVNVAAGSVLAATGTVIGQVTNAGSLLLGPSPGTLILNGRLTLLGSANLRLALGGGVAGVSHDLVVVSNVVQFAGTLRVALVNGFVPASNAVFTVMQFASRLGAFSNAPNGSRIPVESGEPGSFLVEYTDGELRLSNFQGPLAGTNDIPDSWAMQYFGHAPLTPAERAADPDGDGLSNYEEYVAGTHPLEAASVLRVTALTTNASGHCVILFSCVPGKTYGVAYSTNLPVWFEIPEPVFTQPAAGTCAWFDDGSQTGGVPSPAGPRRFYRVSVR